ncbi:hypothetical protein P691DRAFT_763555 [Macrolepiota fuliginosa MF-IS2]|uniref:Methyltransferase type 11 domain-containing protein n=1 Tax=Macrolepiota fuliginosa MF-IS2 TaxID=1400762 RepID=A0A9P5X579_9AGAR|nr:hypothetical protein P691DRAFT_763555 [Macrolepiota fuliginosa MF-IS2]
MCKRFPKVLVTGLDLTDWNLGDSFLPKNYIFTKCDLAGGLSLDLVKRFDLIQCRAVLQHIPEPQSLTEDLARCLKPGGILLMADGELSQGSFDRTKKQLKPFVYDSLVSAEQNRRRANMDREVSWFAGWLCAFGKGLESPRYCCPDKLAQASKLLGDIKLRDVWMDVSWSEDFLGRGRKQGVEELICINYLKAFNAVRSVLMRQDIPESFTQDIWQPRIVEELKTREFTSLWHYISAVRVDESTLAKL